MIVLTADYYLFFKKYPDETIVPGDIALLLFLALIAGIIAFGLLFVSVVLPKDFRKSWEKNGFWAVLGECYFS